MPSQAPQFKLRADLREPQRSSSHAGLPGGWWIWCLCGLAVGLSGWLASKHFLRQQLSIQLGVADSVAEALEAVDGLLKLDERGAIELVRGLEHLDERIARAAFQALDRSIGDWRLLAPDQRNERWHSLAVRLNELRPSIPPERLILASSLAARIYADGLAAGETQLQSTMQLCQSVIQKAGRSADSLDATIEQNSLTAIDRRIALAAPPPPLPPNDPAASSAAKATLSFGDSEARILTEQYTATDSSSDRGGSKQALIEPTTELEAQRTALRLVSSPTRSRQDSAANSSNSHRMALSDSDGIRSSSLAMNGPFPPSVVAENQTGEEAVPPSLDVCPDSAGDEKALSGIESLPIAELVRLLASVQPRIAQAAALALRRKGMTDDKLELATDLATGTIERRTQLVNAVASRGDLDPRPWLLWMAQDGQPEIRRQSVALLSSMLDADVLRQLRMLLNREQDETVARSIRQALLAPRLADQVILR